ADEVGQKLDVHAQIEEKIFYPACRGLQDEDARKMVGESLEEHLIVKRLIAELARLDASDERFEAKATVLKESVEHHADEEEKDLFPEAERELGDDRLEELGARMAELKRRLTSGAGAEGGRRGRSGSSGARGKSSSSARRSGQSNRGASPARPPRGGRPASGSSGSRSRSSGSTKKP